MFYDLQDCNSVGQILCQQADIKGCDLLAILKDGILDYDNVVTVVKETEKTQLLERRGWYTDCGTCTAPRRRLLRVG